MKRAVTLLEIVLVLVIVSILSVATFKAVSKIVVKSFKAKMLTQLTLESQIVLDQISNLLADRIPATVIGYNPNAPDFLPLGQIDTDGYTILEWYTRAMDEFKAGYYTGFCDMVPTIKSDNKVHTFDFNATELKNSGKTYNLIFAGSFDRALSDIHEYNRSFGWHKNIYASAQSKASYEINLDDSNESDIDINDTDKPSFAYEKFFLANGAMAIARGEDIDRNATCIQRDLDTPIDENTLLLFYNYHPWDGKTFCADKNGGQLEGNVTILMRHVQGFHITQEDHTIRIRLDVNYSRPGLGDIHFTKQKVVF